jgi:AcrR family transcriptional regulator
VSRERGKVGRPRNNQRELTRAPDEEILFHAARLFATKRFEGTSTREIAEAAGLRQSSLFHYFRTKEDILVRLSEDLNLAPLAKLAEIRALDADPAEKLYRVLRSHVHLALAERWAWRAVLENSQTISKSRFRRYLAQEAEYCDGIADIVSSGVARGVFVDEPAGLATARLLGMCNWSLRWFKRSGAMSAAEMADYLAESGVRSLAVEGGVAEAAAAAVRGDLMADRA